MPVVNVRVVRVLVNKGFVHVGMDMWLLAIPREIMCVLMMLVVTVWMRVLHRLMRMHVIVPLAQVQPNAKRH